MKLIRICLLVVFSLSLSSMGLAEELKPVVFFDLGDVILDTHDMKDIHYFGSTKKIISEVKSAKLKTGLIINIPASFGADCSSKFQKLKSFIATSWRIGAPEFNWNDFDYIYLPPSDALRKPHPYLFIAGMTKACPSPMIYMGEDQSEVKSAANLGIASHWVGVTGDPEFLSMTEILGQSSEMPQNCDFTEVWKDSGIPDGFEGCLIER